MFSSGWTLANRGLARASAREHAPPGPVLSGGLGTLPAALENLEKPRSPRAARGTCAFAGWQDGPLDGDRCAGTPIRSSEPPPWQSPSSALA
ncbi:MAG: hypothetical protein IPN19_12595 [Elusimicrobia bacterium]|nr:hypothetical protein [Elusimicrobiota bacterium]